MSGGWGVSWGADDVTVRFGDRTALEHVSLDVPAGLVTAVVGGDGAGKTTLLRALAGALAVTGGVVRRPDAVEIGYLPSSSGTYPDLTVDENLAFAASAYRVAPAEARSRARAYLERTGLDRFRDRLAGDLSGGMRQKLGVVRALVHRPKLVILDEPTTGVDPVSRADLWWLITRAAVDGAAVVFATTYLEEAARAPHLLVLDRGRRLADGSPAEIVARLPGTIGRRADRPVEAGAAARAWRRRGRWQVWEPDGTGGSGNSGDSGDAGAPDLEDAITVFLLQRELQP